MWPLRLLWLRAIWVWYLFQTRQVTGSSKACCRANILGVSKCRKLGSGQPWQVQSRQFEDSGQLTWTGSVLFCHFYSRSFLFFSFLLMLSVATFAMWSVFSYFLFYMYSPLLNFEVLRYFNFFPITYLEDIFLILLELLSMHNINCSHLMKDKISIILLLLVFALNLSPVNHKN